MTTPEFRDYHRRAQLFILLYIEAGSYIEEEDDRWEFVVLYERRQRKDAPRTPVYHFVGYSSLYPFWCWPDKIRLRLRSFNPIHSHRKISYYFFSQFVILTPYQRDGHGCTSNFMLILFMFPFWSYINSSRVIQCAISILVDQRRCFRTHNWGSRRSFWRSPRQKWSKNAFRQQVIHGRSLRRQIFEGERKIRTPDWQSMGWRLEG